MERMFSLISVRAVKKGGKPYLAIENMSVNPPCRILVDKREALWVGKQQIKEALKMLY